MMLQSRMVEKAGIETNQTNGSMDWFEGKP